MSTKFQDPGKFQWNAADIEIQKPIQQQKPVPAPKPWVSSAPIRVKHAYHPDNWRHNGVSK